MGKKNKSNGRKAVANLTVLGVGATVGASVVGGLGGNTQMFTGLTGTARPMGTLIGARLVLDKTDDLTVLGRKKKR